MTYDNTPQLNPVEYGAIQVQPAPAPVPPGPVLAVVRRVLIVLAIPVAWFILAILLWYAAPRAGPLPRIGSIIRAHYPDLVSPLKIVLLFCWFAALALVIIAEFSRKRGGMISRRAAGFSAVTVLLLPVPLTYVDMPGLWPMWQDRGQLRLAGSGTYHLQSGGILQGTTVAITQELSRGHLFLRTRVLALAGGESYALLVRPRGAANYDLASPGAAGPWLRLVSSTDARWLVAIRLQGTQACGAAIAYDLRRSQPYGLANLHELSPFILIGPNDSLNEADAAALMREMEPDSSSYALAEMRDALARESRNPNPRVRELVEMILTRSRRN
ncbi:MAG: hypothetical protein MUQ65_04395 [Armatimonadetes bacterium]|nr:hypothetical protein [Armatimonadota bacterium]